MYTADLNAFLTRRRKSRFFLLVLAILAGLSAPAMAADTLAVQPHWHMSGLLLKNEALTALRGTLLPVPPDQFTRNFGFFCRMEQKMPLWLPLKLRLGTNQESDKLEGKIKD